MVNGKRILLLLLSVLIILTLISFVLPLTQVGVLSPTSGQNVSGNITLNAITDAPADNVTFRWTQGGLFILNTTIYNNTANDTVFDNASFDTTALPDGVYNLTVNATNSSGATVGNNSITGITVDNNAPVVTLDSPINNTNTSDSTPALNFTYTDLFLTASCTLYVDDVSHGSNSSVDNATSTSITASTITDGDHNWYINCTDGSGNVGQSGIFNISIDSFPSSSITSPSNGSYTNDNTPTVTLMLTDDLSSLLNYTLFINDTLNLTGNATNSTAKTVTLGTLVDGSYTLIVEAEDSINQRTNSSVVIFTVDTISPVIDSFSLSDTTPKRNSILTGDCPATDNNGGFTRSITGLSTAAVGTFTATCTITDLAGNTDTETVSFKISSTRSSSSGSSYTAPNPQKSRVWETLNKSVPGIMKISDSDIGLTEIIINVNNSVNDVKIKVEKLAGKPAAVTVSISGKVYKYLEITPTNIKNSDLDGAVKIKFQVTKSWLTSSGISENDVVLKRYTDKWVDLPTTKTDSTSAVVNYESETPGFSYFVIGEKEEGSEETIIKEQEDEEETQVTEEGLPEEPEETTEESAMEKESAEETEEESGSSGAFTFVLVILVLVAGLYFYFNRHE